MKKLFATFSAVTLFAGVLAMGVQKPADAGAVGGPKIGVDKRVAARCTHTYQVRFWGDERARIEAQGDGDIDIFVYDANGDRVTFDNLTDSFPIVEWFPTRTQTYTIVVVNCENYPVDYTLETN